jgi:ribonucleotide reductase beta subunit family protein with ferritin-like domain
MSQTEKPQQFAGDHDRNFSRFLAQVSGRIIWSYQEDRSQVSDLYEVAKKKVWNASQDVDWKDADRKLELPVDEDANPLRGFYEYEQLSHREKLHIGWWLHGLELSEVLHGEQGALIVASQLVSCMPTVEAKLFASSQVSDEARHVEFFSEYLKEVVGTIQPPSWELERLIKSMIQNPSWDMKFISCQILIESLAMAKFQELREKALSPIMRFAIDYIAKDEARHVKFGTLLLRDYIASLPPSEVQLRSDYVLDNVLRLANAQNVYTRIADEMNWDENALRYHLRKYRIANPQINRSKFRQLALNLSSVGLMTNQTEERLHTMNVL